MKTLLLCGVSVAALIAAESARAQIGAVFCVNCAEETTQTTSWATSLQNQAQDLQNWARNLGTQLQQLTHEANSDLSLAKSIIGLEQSVFSDHTPAANGIQQLLGVGSLNNSANSFLLNNLSSASGFQGGISNPAGAMTSQNNAVALAYRQLQTAITQGQSSMGAFSAGYNNLNDNSIQQIGILGATQSTNELLSTIGQQEAQHSLVMMAAYQADATARLAALNRQTMYETANTAQFNDAIQAACASITRSGGAAPAECNNVGTGSGATGSSISGTVTWGSPTSFLIPGTDTPLQDSGDFSGGDTTQTVDAADFSTGP